VSKKKLKSELENPVANPMRIMYAHEFPKDGNYRTPLEPYIGMKVTVYGTYDRFEVKGNEECEETYMLIQNVRIAKAPRLSGKANDEPVNHMWIMIPADYIVRNKIRRGDILYCKGVLYEYAKRIGSNPVRNIGLNLMKSRIEKADEPQETAVTPTFVIQAKRKATIENYETEIAMQIENIIRNQAIKNFSDLTLILHEYPVLYEVVMRNPEHFRIIMESYAEKRSEEKTAVVAPTIPIKPVAEDKRHIIKAGTIEYDLNTSKGKNDFKNHLQKLVQKYITDNPAVLTKPKDKIFLIGDGQMVLGIQDKTSKNYCSGKKMETFLNAHSYVDICCYDISGNFKYRHLDMYSS